MTFWRSFPREGQVALGPRLEYAKGGEGYLLVCAWPPLMVLDFEGVKKVIIHGLRCVNGASGWFLAFSYFGNFGSGWWPWPWLTWDLLLSDHFNRPVTPQ